MTAFDEAAEQIRASVPPLMRHGDSGAAVAPLVHHVTVVVFCRTTKKMPGIHTNGVVAVVTNE